MPDNTLTARCWHEAGHATLAALLVRVTSVDVLSGPDRGGITRYRANPTRAAWQIAIICAGGLAAECLRFGLPRAEAASLVDFELAEEHLVRAGLAYSRRAVLGDATRLLQANWAAVEAVAEALQVRGRLDGAELCDLVAAHLDVPRYRVRVGGGHVAPAALRA